MNSKITKLFIIGNGFDINLGIKSRYEDFKEYYSNNKFKIIDSLGIPPIKVSGQKYSEYLDEEEAENVPVTEWELTSLDFLYSASEGTFDPYGLEEGDYFWNEFETNLGCVDVFSIGQHYISEDGNVTTRGNIEGLNDLKQNLEDSFIILNIAVSDWACQIKLPKLSLKIDDEESFFFTFNYTLTLEKIYGVNKERVYHIHGSVKDPSSIKVGSDFKNDYSTIDFITGTYDIFQSYFHQLSKNPKERIASFRQYLRDHQLSLVDVDTIIVLGHSFNDVDWFYFSSLKKLCKPAAKWIVSIHCDGDKENFRRMATKLNINLNNVTIIKSIDEMLKV